MKKMQHYVPQFYMKYWGDGNKQLWQYRKDRNRFLKCSTTQKGCCNYDSEMENTISINPQSSNRYNVLYGKSEEQLRYMIQLLQSFHIQS